MNQGGAFRKSCVQFPFHKKDGRKKGDRKNTEKIMAALMAGRENGTGWFFRAVRTDCSFSVCLFRKKTLFLKIKENFFTPY